jgi:choline dehydrogenase-like flavoprotein
VLIDARSVPAGAEFTCDLCVVGAGPAGIAIVDRLRGSGLSIVLLESGGFHPELPTQQLFRGENRGRAYYRLDACRFRLFGGSTNRWGGWCRPLEAVDFTRRDWLPWSGWPIGDDALEPYTADTAKLFELSDPRFDLGFWRDRLPSPFALDGTDFENALFQYSPETNFGDVYRAQLATAPTVRVLLHANLTQIELVPGSSRVGCLRVAALTGGRFAVRPRAVVLAAGGIENARLLLASHNDRPAGLGNEHDRVGRFFMEHVHVPAGHWLASPAAADRRFYRKAAYADAVLRGVITPTAAAQERHRLLATSIAVEPASYSFGSPFLGWPPPVTFGAIGLYRRMRAGSLKIFAENLKRRAEGLVGMPIRLRTWNAARAARRRAGARAEAGPIYSLYFRAEQAPDPASRVALSGRRDVLGVPETRLDWRISPLDVDSISGWLRVMDRDVRARGLGSLIAPADGWLNAIIGGPHHMGTTRMSADPRNGVVDADCRVHSVENLYVAGSSVFTTAGYANPTFTLVALALRLADTLGERLRARHSVQAGPLGAGRVYPTRDDGRLAQPQTRRIDEADPLELD